MELKPCPFCGGKATIAEMLALSGYIVACETCFCVTAKSETQEEAAEAWNQRIEQTNEWINVNDRLPEENKAVFVYYKNEKTLEHEMYFSIAYITKDENGNFKWQIHFDNCVDSKVVYWLPIPPLFEDD